MTWLSFFIGYFTGTIVTLLMLYFGYLISEENKADEDWYEKSVEKEMEQLRAVRDDELDCR
ncbi:hypothetical protein AT270_02975 [Bacillus cereus]|uniref:hypothetical protein n=1 Tax=Bacillus cereus TaxID=1396 RepID=UPI00077A90EA|nr:hypothetical protein [Bacillus cereus]KXY76003.1 hypothetical protein AT270_02975 [Bacillus cereus]